MESRESRIRFGISLREGLVGPADKREVEVVCIRPGLSRNGNYYGPECLAEAVPLFEGARAYVDHSDATLRSVRDLAGSYKKVRLGGEGEVRATLRISKSQEWLWALIQESVEEGTDLVGLSIDVQAKVVEGQVGGRRARIVEHIHTLSSVDVITKASAGGTWRSSRKRERGRVPRSGQAELVGPVRAAERAGGGAGGAGGARRDVGRGAAAAGAGGAGESGAAGTERWAGDSWG